MGNFSYKCVAISVDVDSENDSFVAVEHAYEKVLNNVAEENWELIKIDTLSFPPKENNYATNDVAVATKISKVLIFRKTNSDKQEVTQLLCPACKNEISIDDDYCENCALKLT
ncbi:MAG: hypothetical protein IPL21_12895 [Saprospirales bacterium]|nr:hypothetical protein [Saprospirales bacterium]